MPLVYLEPFLHVIRSPETSGVVTDVALSSVLNMLEAGLLGTLHVSAIYRDASSILQYSLSLLCACVCEHAAMNIWRTQYRERTRHSLPILGSSILLICSTIKSGHLGGNASARGSRDAVQV